VSILTDLRRLLRRRKRGRTGHRFLLDEPRFRRMLECERMRADRAGHQFCLLGFELQDTRRDLPKLARVLKRRIRLTDRAGILPDGRVGVFLPETPVAGGKRVSADVLRMALEKGISPCCTIYEYPTPDGQAEGDVDQAGTEQRGSRSDPSSTGNGTGGAELMLTKRMPAWKRGMDICGSLFGLVFVSPLLLVSAVAIKLDSRGPIFFRQQRRGLGGRAFTIYKFRTMVVGAAEHQKELRHLSDQDGPAFKMKHDPRVTRVGRWLRFTSIDELPQLWNVLRGDMSLVGPRPLPCDETDACSRWQKRRLSVVPGLTGLWQVRGRNKVTFDQWMRMDLNYAENYSFWQDVRILFMTIAAVLRGTG